MNRGMVAPARLRPSARRPWLPWVALSAGVVVAGALAAFVLVGPGERGTLLASAGPFYVEATVQVAAPADPSIAAVEPFRSPQSQLTLRWWYQSPTLWRWEIRTDHPALDAGTVTTVADGHSLWEYDDRTGEYRRSDLPALPPGAVLPPTFDAPVGPTSGRDLADFLARWRPVLPSIAVAGDDCLLGRDVVVLDFHPAAASVVAASAPARGAGSGVAAGTAAAPAAVQRASGAGRIWLDLQRMVILRWSVDGGAGGQSYSATVTDFEPGAYVDPARTTFRPPAGATATPRATGACSVSGSTRSFDMPAGFLQPGYLPAGFRGSGSATSTDDACRTVAAATVAAGHDAVIPLTERLQAGGLPAALRVGARVSIDGVDGYRTQVDGRERLAWADHGVAAVLESTGAPFVDLLRIARSTRPPAARPDPSTLVAVSCANGELCVSHLEPFDPVPLVEAPAFLPAWSPDHARVAFYELSGGAWWLAVANADGSGARLVVRLNGEAYPVAPAWSPDGTRLALMDSVQANALPGAPTHLLVVDVASGRWYALATAGGSDGAPAWSPDGTRLVFESTRDSSESDIFVVGAGGGVPATLTPGPGRDVGPAYLPDGRIAFFSKRTGDWDLYLMQPDGSDVVNLTHDPAADVATTQGDAAAVVSPDGSRIAFLSDRGGNVEVYVARTDGSGVTRISHDPDDDFAPAWTPDGRFLVFSSYPPAGGTAQWIAPVDGSYQQRLDAAP